MAPSSTLWPCSPTEDLASARRPLRWAFPASLWWWTRLLRLVHGQSIRHLYRDHFLFLSDGRHYDSPLRMGSGHARGGFAGTGHRRWSSTWLPIFAAIHFGLRSFGSLHGLILFSITVGTALGAAFLGWFYQIQRTYHNGYLMFEAFLAIAIVLLITFGPLPLSSGPPGSERRSK